MDYRYEMTPLSERKYFQEEQEKSPGCFYIFSTPYLNGAAALFHGIQSVIVFSLIAWLNSKPIKEHIAPLYPLNSSILNETTANVLKPIDFMNKKPGIFPLHRMINIWHKINDKDSQRVLETMEFGKLRAMSSEFFIETRNLASGEIDVRYIIASFFMLSCVFQVIGGFLYYGKVGARLRFIEYSFSASIMIIAIAVESGIRDLYTIEMMFVLTFVTMILGLLADVVSVITERYYELIASEPIFALFGTWSWIVPHIAGWATCVAAYAPIIDNFHESNSASDTKAPGFVNIIVYLQFSLFSSFGFVQLYSLVSRSFIINSEISMNGINSVVQNKLEILADFVERLYIVLSFSAKTLLAWLILSPIITDAA